jgi:hypothetical protein
MVIAAVAAVVVAGASSSGILPGYSVAHWCPHEVDHDRGPVSEAASVVGVCRCINYHLCTLATSEILALKSLWYNQALWTQNCGLTAIKQYG